MNLTRSADLGHYLADRTEAGGLNCCIGPHSYNNWFIYLFIYFCYPETCSSKAKRIRRGLDSSVGEPPGLQLISVFG